MAFEPGQTSNPRGRPVGSKNKIGRDFHDAYEEAQDRGYQHPYLLMMEWAHDESKPLEVRAAMIKEAASYTCTKPKLTVRSEVPVLSSIEQAESFLATLAAENDLDPIELSAMIRHWIESKRGGQELELKAQGHGFGSELHITVSGGLPSLPGTRIDMPNEPSGLNGHRGLVLNGQASPESEAPVSPTITKD